MISTTSKKLYFLIAIFIVGFLSLFVLNQVFISLVNDLDKQTNNHKNKIQIGEYITEDIFRSKSLFFELATTTTSARSRKLVKDKISTIILHMEESLNVLEKGGTLRRDIDLNVEGHTKIVKNTSYKITNNSQIPIEVIDMRPKLLDLEEMIKEADKLLNLRSKYKKSIDQTEFRKTMKKIRRFYKTTPAFFNRMSENIRRLLYESDIELNNIKNEIEHKKSIYMKIKMALIILVIALVIFIGSRISAIISQDNIKLIKLNEDLETKEKSIKAVLDGQENIVIVSDGSKMVDANEAIVHFFNHIHSIKEFKENYNCICDFFLPNEKEDNYLLNILYDGNIWLEHILANPKVDFRVLMNDGVKNHHFSVSANKKEIDNKGTFIVIVSLNDISKEIKARDELATLNNDLEQIINLKTEELQQLNNNLEIKIEEELEKNREKDKQMMQQSRSAALGEMIGNIAHQWRQPLSAISSTASGLQLQLQLGLTTNEEIDKSYDEIKGYVGFLTQTIEDFRNFFKNDKEKIDFNLVDTIKSSLSIANAGYKDNTINVIENYEVSELISHGLPSELSQVFLNILNNAKDATIENHIEDRFVHIRTAQDEKNNIIYIQDNAGGIPTKIKDKIFDPYFTTKHQAQGTGIGLYMSKDIVEKHMDGLISVENIKITLDNKEYNGACFKIIIPKKS